MKSQIITSLLFMAYCVLGAEEPTAQLTFKVTEESGKPIRQVPVNVHLFDSAKSEIGHPVYNVTNSLTDNDGIAVVRGSNLTREFSYGIWGVAGYYREGGVYYFDYSTNSQWQPWNPTINMVLRPVLNPTPMYARAVETRIPKPNEKFGFDLMAADWVAPLGKGKTADLFFQLSGYAESITNYDSTLTVSFANRLDGIRGFVPFKGSQFRSPREAYIDGYQPQLELRRVGKPGQMSSEWIEPSSIQTNYFFRIRTELDENGNIKSAFYGKIYGNFDFFGAATKGSYLTIPTYYLNPEPNSRNMEFDPKRNLFGRLPSLQEVRDP